MRPLALVWLVCALAVLAAHADPTPGQRLDGFNVIAAPSDPFGSSRAKFSLATARTLGAKAVAVVPFLWQATPQSPDLVRGRYMPDDELRAAIRDAHALGLAVVVKPQVWVPWNWAGAIAMTSETDWAAWFANYRSQLNRIALIAQQEKAEALAIGTELMQTSQRPEWNAVIGGARSVYSGSLFYFAHNLEEAETVPFWQRLDAIGVTLYPPLGADEDRDGRLAIMRAVADRLEVMSLHAGKPVVVGEIGVRSAQGAAAKPWESGDEHPAAPDPNLQADVIADWLSALDRPSVRGVLIWDWLTDPDAGGLDDTDFTVQGKPADQVLACAWAQVCSKLSPAPGSAN
jgi:hypothetical protein